VHNLLLMLIKFHAERRHRVMVFAVLNCAWSNWQQVWKKMQFKEVVAEDKLAALQTLLLAEREYSGNARKI